MSTTSPAPSQVRTMTMPGPNDRRYSRNVCGTGGGFPAIGPIYCASPEVHRMAAAARRTNLAPAGRTAAVRTLADQAFSRAAGAPLVHGNAVRLLKDARENYPAWLAAIGDARESIH